MMMTTRITLLILVLLTSSMVLSQNLVEHLPGFSGKLPFTLETGYIGVGEKEDVQLFYYFVESESEPENDPLVLWFTGGPGCSGLSGLIYEIGPFTIDYANSGGSMPALKLNEYSWTKVASIIFLDQPVGTGFSYATTQEASYSSDTLAATHSYEFLTKWLMTHPKYLKNPLYICGDSYGGIFVPLVVDKVYKGIELGREPRMNMKGYSLGNPVTDEFSDKNGRIPYAHRMGLLSNKLYQSAKEACHGNYINVDEENILCQNVLKRVQECTVNVRKPHILEPWCGLLWLEDRNVASDHVFSYENIPASIIRSITASRKSWCRDDNYVFSATWANDGSVRKALHIREGTKPEWTRCNISIASGKIQPDGTIPYLSDVQSTVAYHMNFTYKNSRALIYSGDHDSDIPHTSTEEWIDSLNLPIQSDWRPWFVEGQVAGYTMTYEHDAYKLTYATVKGAGHTAPEYRPMECLAMIRNWFTQSDFGDHDFKVPHTCTEGWIHSLNLPIQSDWRPWFVQGQVAGYTMTYGHGAYKLTYATVKVIQLQNTGDGMFRYDSQMV